MDQFSGMSDQVVSSGIGLEVIFNIGNQDTQLIYSRKPVYPMEVLYKLMNYKVLCLGTLKQMFICSL